MKRIRDAQTIIGMIEGGAVAADLSNELTETIRELKEHCGGNLKAKAKGEVKLTIKLEVEAGTARLSAEISSKRPKRPRDSEFFFALDDGSLSTEHPKQIDMFSVRDITVSAAE